MAVITYHKLIRDNIPKIIRAAGAKPTVRKLAEAEFEEALLAKLGEETAEVQATVTSHDRLKELADVLEVVKALADLNGTTMDQLEVYRANRATERGAFRKRLFLITVEEKG